MGPLGAALELDHGGDGLTIAACSRQTRHWHRIDPTVGAKPKQGVHRSALKGVVQGVTGLESKAAGVVPMTSSSPHPTFVGDHHRHGLVNDFDFDTGALVGQNQGSTLVAKKLGVGLDFFDHQAAL